jgi:hypothetical protein
MPKLTPGNHEMEIDVTANGQQYMMTKLKFIYQRKIIFYI